jgi:hypothetical protein
MKRAVMPCRLVKVNWEEHVFSKPRGRGRYDAGGKHSSLLHAGFLLGLLLNREDASDTYLRNVTGVHVITSQKTEISTMTAARTSIPNQI